MRYFYAFLIFTAFLGAENYRDALFASIRGVEKGDVLNVRAKPDYRSKKLGSLDYDFQFNLGIERCREIKPKSLWCKIYTYGPLAPKSLRGWVNARFLKFSGRGYVLVDRKGNCDYSLGCKNGYCRVVADYRVNKQGEITSISTKRVNRRRLKATDHFGAMPPDGDGYCVLHSKLGDYLNRKKRDQKQASRKSNPKKVAIDFIKAIDSRDWKKVADFVSPKYGVVLTDFIRFNYENMDKRVSKRAFFDALKRNSKLVKEYQGEIDDTDAPLNYLGVRSFLKSLLNGKNITAVDEVEDDLRGFRGVGTLKGFIVLWRGRDSYSRTGAVIILKRVGSRWFVVGVAKERWTI